MMTRTGLSCSWFLITVTIVGKANIIFGQSIVMRLKDPAGEIMSDGYPNSTSVFKGWNITVTEGYRIHLEFLDFMLNETMDCRNESVTLYDAPVGDFDRRVGQWCWNNFSKLMQNTFNSTSNSFYLLFNGQEGNSRKGFKARYYSITNSSVVTTIETTWKCPTAESSTNPNTPLSPDGVINQGISTTAGAFIFVVIGFSCVIYLMRCLKSEEGKPVNIAEYDINHQATNHNNVNHTEDYEVIPPKSENGERRNHNFFIDEKGYNLATDSDDNNRSFDDNRKSEEMVRNLAYESYDG